MKVTLYQEGDWHCSPNVIKIFSTLELALQHIPKGFVSVDAGPGKYAENKEDERWITIKEYQIVTSSP